MSNIQALNLADPTAWVEVCDLAAITPNTGVCACIEGEQIAIFRVGQEQRVYALSNLDPFSQAYVMSRGILGDLQNERVVASPMYKQHFSLATGRCLEDPQYRLQVFPSKVQQGKVWLSPQPQKTYISSAHVPSKKLKLVLLGHSLLGLRCLEDLRQLAAERYDITLLSNEPCANDDWMQMLEQLSCTPSTVQGAAVEQMHTLTAALADHVHWIKDAAVKIDRQAKQVLTQSGQLVDYDRLILATGTQLEYPAIAGLDLQGVLGLNHLTDVQRMFADVREHQRACVVGSGALAIAAADALGQRGLQVDLICSQPDLIEQHLDVCSRFLLQQRLEQHNIKVHRAVQLQSLQGEQGQLKQLYLDNGLQLATEMLVFASDAVPNIALAKQAGLQCQRGVWVNDTMQSFDPCIYALGECIEHRGQSTIALEPLWGQALTCASHLAERGSLSYQAPMRMLRLDLLGCAVFSVGDIAVHEDNEDIILNDEKRQIYKRIVIQQDRMIGAVLLGDLDDADWYAELIANKTVIRDIRHKLLFGRDFALRQAG